MRNIRKLNVWRDVVVVVVIIVVVVVDDVGRKKLHFSLFILIVFVTIIIFVVPLFLYFLLSIKINFDGITFYRFFFGYWNKVERESERKKKKK